MPNPEQQFFDIPTRKGGVKQHRLGYLDWPGPSAAAPAVVCVHGLTRNAHDFDFFAAALSSDFRVIAADMPGRGYSDWLEDTSGYGYGTYIADCIALLDHLKLEQVRWVGTSMGGVIGMSIAAHLPQRILRLVLNDIGKRIPKAAMERIVSYAGGEHLFQTRGEAEEYLRDITQPFGIRDPMRWRRFAEHSIWEIKKGTFTLACDPEILAPYREQTEEFHAIEDIDLAEPWSKVACPVLLLRGKESDLLTPAIAAEMQTDNPAMELVEFDGVGHAPSLMEDAQIRVVKDWLLSSKEE